MDLYFSKYTRLIYKAKKVYENVVHGYSDLNSTQIFFKTIPCLLKLSAKIQVVYLPSLLRLHEAQFYKFRDEKTRMTYSERTSFMHTGIPRIQRGWNFKLSLYKNEGKLSPRIWIKNMQGYIRKQTPSRKWRWNVYATRMKTWRAFYSRLSRKTRF